MYVSRRSEDQFWSSWYACNICGTVFPIRHDLESHHLTHQEKSVQCKHCPFKCNTERYLKRHMKTRHYHIKDTKARQAHVKSHVKLQTSEVKKLNNQGGNEGRKDEPGHSTGDKLECFICNKMLSSLKSLKSHVKSHTAEAKKQGKKKQKDKSKPCESLKSHVKIHTGETSRKRSDVPCKCEICGKVMASRRGMKKHRLTHFEKSLKCDHCPAMFRYSHAVKHHMIRQHTKEWPFTCSECGKGFIYQCEKEYHEKLHSADSQQCKECDKVFLDPKLFDAHVKEHEMAGAFECTTCGKSFSSKVKLRDHMRTHSAKYQVQVECPVCKKTLSRKSLKSHVKIHTGETRSKKRRDVPCQCEICGKVVASRRGMQKHRLTHFEKSLKCDHCPAMFRFSRTLGHHMIRQHTKEWPFLCSECGKGFIYQRKGIPRETALSRSSAMSRMWQGLCRSQVVRHSCQGTWNEI